MKIRVRLNETEVANAIIYYLQNYKRLNPTLKVDFHCSEKRDYVDRKIGGCGLDYVEVECEE